MSEEVGLRIYHLPEVQSSPISITEDLEKGARTF